MSALAQTRRGSLLILNEDNTAKELQVDGQSEPQDIELSSAEEKASYSNSYFSQMGPGLSSVIVLANFNNDTGAVDSKEGAEQPDLLIKTL